MARRRRKPAPDPPPHPEPPMEFVLLAPSDEGDPYVVLVPEGATAHVVPNRNDVILELRGKRFARTDEVDPICEWPIFRRQSWQV